MPETNGTNKPEVKYGPFPGGFGVTIWRNKTADGRHFRSITISPRRYKDSNGQWQDAGSFRPIDLATLILALQQAQRHVQDTPLPSDADENEPAVAASDSGQGGEQPF